jgi:energy-coupling factor transporter ATP-binding protein EcfA2
VPATIRFEDVSFSYPDGTPALRELTFSIKRDERVALLGENGSGKSTLFLALLGFLSPQAGEITVDGTRLNGDTIQTIRSKIGLVFQNPDDQLFCPTVYDDVEFGPWNTGMEEEERAAIVESTLRDVGLWHLKDKPPHHLSWGEKRRAALATVLSMRPGILLLDEPTAYLDPPSTNGLHRLLRRYTGTMILATHDVGFAGALCERVLIMDAGAIRHDGPISGLLADTKLLASHGLVQQFDGPEPS